MGLRMVNVIHPKRRITTYADLRNDGLWETPDGFIMEEGKLSQDRGDGGIIWIGLLIIMIAYLLS